MAERVDFNQDQGATMARRFIWKTDTATPTPMDLTSFTARMHIRTSFDAEATATLTTENGGIVLGGEDGYVDLHMTATQTAEIPTGSYRYDLELVSPDDFVVRLIEGKIKFRPEVTR